MQKKIQWPTAAVLMTAIVALASTAIALVSMGWSSADVASLLAGEGGFWALALAAMRQLREPAPSSQRKPRAPDVGGPVALALACIVGGSAAAGCGAGPAEQHARLNALTDIADPTYEQAVELCDRLRDRIVARADSTEAEDRADMQSVHDVCDPMVAGFEALRGSQVTARAAIDDGLGGAASQAIAEALALWPSAQRLVERIRAATAGGDTGGE